MPAQSIWMIRISLGYFLIITLIGSLLLVHKVTEIHPMMWALLPAHYEMAIWGWMVQFVLGTAYWIFPRYLNLKPRGSERIAWLIVILLNSGVFLLVIENQFQISQLFKISARFLIIASILCFASIMWKRVIRYKNHEHEH